MTDRLRAFVSRAQRAQAAVDKILAEVPTIRIPTPQPSIIQAWENFVAECERQMGLGAICPWCEGQIERGALEHTDDCVFDAMDRAVGKWANRE